MDDSEMMELQRVLKEFALHQPTTPIITRRAPNKRYLYEARGPLFYTDVKRCTEKVRKSSSSLRFFSSLSLLCRILKALWEH
jgi:hypothetical protein